MRQGLRDARAAGGMLWGLRPFLRGRVDAREARARLERQLADREQSFMQLLRGAICANPASPYRRLLEWARIDVSTVEAMLADGGLESTLERLHDAGIFITLEEFKGRRPIVRPGLELAAAAGNFDNPLGARQYETRTGGSGGAARRVTVGLDLLAHESLYHAAFHDALGIAGRRAAMWLPAPPGAVGIKNALIRARLGEPVDAWFSQTRPGDAPVRHRAFAQAVAAAVKACGVRLPHPVFTPASDAVHVARWMAGQRAAGAPGLVLTTPSGAVRACVAAGDRGLDVAGTWFVLVGEPFTTAKAGLIARAGCRAASHYAMVESGMIGLACGAPVAADDVHVVSDKMATIQRDRPAGVGGTMLGALLHTTLRTATPKVMLNVESGDYGELELRDCGCGVLPPRFRQHLHTIRSYEKLTGEGMHFLGTDLLQLLEHVLPARFGGHPTDYQLVESEAGGLTRVTLMVRSSVGAIDAEAVVRAMVAFLRARGPGQRLMAEAWANAGTLQVVRGEPHVTMAGKIQPLQKSEPLAAC